MQLQRTAPAKGCRKDIGCQGKAPAQIRTVQHQRACKQLVRAAPEQREQDTDLVTGIVAKIFGDEVVEDRQPFGLKRMDWSQVKDLEVIMDREAEPVATDDPYMAMIRPLLAGTTLETEPLRCAYSASEDGWTPSDFHERVSGYGSCVILGRTVGGAVFGGYNPLGFDGFGNDKASMGAFLFTWPDGDTKNKKPYKLPKIGTDQLAVVDKMDQGPQFGPGDLKIMMVKGSSKTKASSKLIDYQRPPTGAKSVFGPEEGTKTELVELRAFVRKGGKLKYELDGVRWKSSYVKDGSGQGPPPGIFTM